MGWFGSLGLAYKYGLVFGSLLLLVVLAGYAKVLHNRRRLKKFTKEAELEASGAQEERVELNARELDEGDLFGIRAIQSGYFGGVAQSRPTSEAGSHSPNESVSRAFFGSPNLIATSPISSVTALPLDARQSSPLGQGALSPNEAGRTATPHRPPLRLQPSEAELSGRINHDPTVNMSLEIPPSPLTPTRPQIPTSNGGSRANPSAGSGTLSSAGSRSPSPSYPFPAPNNKLNPPSTVPHRQDPPSENRGSARPVSTAAIHNQPVHSQSASIVSKSSDNSNHDEPRSPNQYSEFPTRPARTIHPERSTSYGSYHPPRTSSIPRAASPSAAHQHRDDSVSIPRPLRIGPAAGDWGNDIFHEIDRSIHESKSIAPPVNHQVYLTHASKPSDSSSIYSSSNAGQRYSTKKLSIDSKSHSQTTSTLPSSTPSETDAQHSYPATLPEGTRRGSDASSHQHALSNQSTSDGSHRHTKELGDFYDSYWRQSNTGPLPSRAGEMYKPHHSGFSNSRGTGDMGKESRRPGQMDLKVATIAEIPTPLSSPMPGTAL